MLRVEQEKATLEQ